MNEWKQQQQQQNGNYGLGDINWLTTLSNKVHAMDVILLIIKS